MAKLTLDPILSDYASRQKFNSNFDDIEDALENTLSRDGSSPNHMTADLDMNSQKVLNLPDAASNGEPVTYRQWIANGGSSATVSSATLINFLQAGTGAVSRTVASKFQDWISVKDFGAVGNNSHDDTVAIQAAIDSLSAAGGTVYFPKGTYKITAAITLPAAYIRLTGTSSYLGSVITGTHSGNLLTAVYTQFLEIDHLAFSGSGCSAYRQTTLTSYTSTVHIHHCHFYANLTECLYGNFILSDISYNTFGYFGTPGATHRHIVSDGDVTSNATNANHIHHNRFYAAVGSNSSVYWEAGYGLVIDHNNFESNSTAALLIKGISRLTIEHNHFEGNNNLYEVVLTDDLSATIGNYVVRVENNMFVPHANVTHLFSIAGVTNFYFNYNNGSIAGKYITTYGANDAGIIEYIGNRFVGYTRSNYDTTSRVADAFSATVGSTINNQTGDGTAYVVVFGTEAADNLSGYNNTTGVFTASTTGMYHFSSVVGLEGLLVGHTEANIELVTTNLTYTHRINPYALSAGGLASIQLSIDAFMNPGDTAKVRITIAGSTKVVDISGTSGGKAWAYFSGHKIYNG